MTWEVNPRDLTDRIARAAAIRSADVRDQRITLGALRGDLDAAPLDRDHDPACDHYAHCVFSLASGEGEVRTESPDAVGEEVLTVKSHTGVPITFSLEHLRGFNPSSIAAAPVEPVDSQFRMYGGRCLVLRNVLTLQECSCLIREMSRDMEPVTFRRDYRRNDRSIFDSPELADVLWQRVRPFASGLIINVDQDPARQRLLLDGVGGCPASADEECPEELRVGYGREGIWRPCGLNECIRFCRYGPGDFFRKHCDAPFCRSEDEQSLFTCMFYLDGGLQGGATRFLRIGGTAPGSDQFARAEDSDVLASVAPEPGMCILFFQPGLMHEGEDLKSGVKHILRTDVMFRRDADSKPVYSPRVAEARRLGRQAQDAEARGECDLACGLYRRAFKLDPRLERMF